MQRGRGGNWMPRWGQPQDFSAHPTWNNPPMDGPAHMWTGQNQGQQYPQWGPPPQQWGPSTGSYPQQGWGTESGPPLSPETPRWGPPPGPPGYGGGIPPSWRR